MKPSDTSEASSPGGGGKLAYAVLSVVFLLVALHHTARRASAYLFASIAAPMPWVVAAHALGLVVGASLAARSRAVAPSRGPFLLALSAWLFALANVGAFATFGHSTVFLWLVFGAAALLGLALGALFVTLARTLPAIRYPASTNVLGTGVVLTALVATVLYLVASDRAGPLRTGVALVLGLLLVAHRGATSLAPHSAKAVRTALWTRWSAFGFAAALVLVEPLSPWFETSRLPDPVVYGRNTVSSRVTLTSGRGAFQLYLDGVLRVSSIDAHRKREALVHPAMQVAPSRGAVLILGGGDGTALREVLAYPDVRRVVLIEPDAAVLHVGRNQPALRHENANAFHDARVVALRADPLTFLRETRDRYDVVVVDVADPDTPARSKLFSRHFYRLLREHLQEGGVGAVTLPSPTSTLRAFGCVVKTLKLAELFPVPYRVNLPTQGTLGMSLIARHPVVPPNHTGRLLTYLDDATLADLFRLAPDETPPEDVEPQLLHHQVLHKYREEPSLL